MKAINMEWMKSLLEGYEPGPDFTYQQTLSDEERLKGRRILRKLCQQIEQYVEDNSKEYLDEEKNTYTIRDTELVRFEGLRRYLEPQMCKYVSYKGINDRLFPRCTKFREMTRCLYKRYLGIDDDVILEEMEQYKVSRFDLCFANDVEIETAYQYRWRKRLEAKEERRRQAAEYKRKQKALAKQAKKSNPE